VAPSMVRISPENDLSAPRSLTLRI
jgi:hypothetical protein